MRIALLAWESKHSIAIGGLAEHVTELGDALHRRGHEIHVFTRVGEGQSTYDVIEGVHYHRCPFESHPDFLVDNHRMCDSFVWHLAETENNLEAPFDIVHGHDWLSVRAIAQAKNRHGRPTVMTVHSTEYGRCGNQLWEGDSRRIREIEWEGTYIADRVICVSGAFRREIQDLYSVPGDKLHVIYNGVDVRRFDTRVNTRTARTQYAVGADDPFVLFAGRMTAQKGPDLLVEAIPALLRDHPTAKFVFAGDGDMRSGLQQRTATLGVSPAARFVGHRSGRDLVTLFKSADLVCVPSRNEPFGIVILEAWSARKPVVATRNGGPGEFVTHDNTGITVTDDHADIGRGIRTVLDNRAKGRQMGRNGRKEAESRFNWDTIATATEEVYRSVCTDRSRITRHQQARIQEVTGMAKPRRATGQGSKPKNRQPVNTTSNARTAKSTKTPIGAPTTKMTPPKAMRADAVPMIPEPSVEAIRKRAYEIYVERNGADGDPAQDWLKAERELRQIAIARPAAAKPRVRATR